MNSDDEEEPLKAMADKEIKEINEKGALKESEGKRPQTACKNKEE